MTLTSKYVDLAPWGGHPSNRWASYYNVLLLLFQRHCKLPIMFPTLLMRFCTKSASICWSPGSVSLPSAGLNGNDFFNTPLLLLNDKGYKIRFIAWTCCLRNEYTMSNDQHQLHIYLVWILRLYTFYVADSSYKSLQTWLIILLFKTSIQYMYIQNVNHRPGEISCQAPN